MEQKISFIHCADIHLDSPFKGMSHLTDQIIDQVRNSTFEAFEQLIELAIEKKVDFILIVGDLFDREDQSMKAHMTVVRGFRRLKDHGIQVFLSFGNHDHIKSQTFPRNYPDNVFIYEKEQVEVMDYLKNDQRLAKIYGFSYNNRAVETNMVPQFKREDDGLFHIACLHGTAGNMNSDHANYAPFQLNELKQLDFHYWALGHIHKREVLSSNPLIVYPGNTQARSIKETGDKGCYHVVLSESEDPVIQFCRLDQIQFHKLSVDASKWTDITDAVNEIERYFHKVLQKLDKVLIELNFYGATDKVIKWQKEGHLNDMITLWNEQYADQTNWIQVIGIKVIETKKKGEWQGGEQFLRQLQTTFHQTADIEEILSPLWHHVDGRKWLDPLDLEEQEELLSLAKDEAFYLLHSMGDNE
ncbi:DNA repair exonuclease SbcCD nuclease subunit [Gracilibacillus ureilyticus]|uniref:DNA repair exonuclease SbcCD nuclease subunit n=1 Tax=Gracilibacillus ureilyticus TaxID=531814 RepID=A0A1H9SJJ3_9BACI|nr:DNA repair exonuclease [Gracilibacillus ureilyticus]SER85206.1 DNA repair exonuclease SbcCD nuclease subunit [Gracilibacillus ureilyticus]